MVLSHNRSEAHRLQLGHDAHIQNCCGWGGGYGLCMLPPRIIAQVVISPDIFARLDWHQTSLIESAVGREGRSASRTRPLNHTTRRTESHSDPGPTDPPWAALVNPSHELLRCPPIRSGRALHPVRPTGWLIFQWTVN